MDGLPEAGMWLCVTVRFATPEVEALPEAQLRPPVVMAEAAMAGTAETAVKVSADASATAPMMDFLLMDIVFPFSSPGSEAS